MAQCSARAAAALAAMAAWAAALMHFSEAGSLLFAAPPRMLASRAVATAASSSEVSPRAAEAAGRISYSSCATTLLFAAAVLGLHGRMSAVGSSLLKRQRLRLVARKAEEGEADASEEAADEEADKAAEEAAAKKAEEDAKKAEEEAAAKKKAEFEAHIKKHIDAGQARFAQAEADRLAAFMEREKVLQEAKTERLRKKIEADKKAKEKMLQGKNMLAGYVYDKEKISQLEAEQAEKRAQKEAEKKAEEERKAKHDAEAEEILAAKKAARQADPAKEMVEE